MVSVNVWVEGRTASSGHGVTSARANRAIALINSLMENDVHV